MKPPNRARWFVLAVAIVSGLMTAGALAEITIVSWGGPYERSQRKAYFEPFTKQTGIRITIERYNGGLAELRKQVREANGGWDLIDMTMADNQAACKEGLLQRIDHSILESAPDGTPASEDFIAGGLTKCGVTPDHLCLCGGLQPRRLPGGKAKPSGGSF